MPAKKKKRRSKAKPRKKNPAPEPLFPAEWTDRLKGAASAVLGEVERDPENALNKLGVLGRELKRVVEQNPRETNRQIKNAAVSALAHALRKGISK